MKEKTNHFFDTNRKIGGQILTTGIFIPYCAWAFVLFKINFELCRSFVLFDVLLILSSGFCFYKKFLNRAIRKSEDNELKSRVWDCLAAMLLMLWIGIVFSVVPNICINVLGTLFASSVLTTVVGIALKTLMVIHTIQFIEPKKTNVSIPSAIQLGADSQVDEDDEVETI